jgi:magnesium transporter
MNEIEETLKSLHDSIEANESGEVSQLLNQIQSADYPRLVDRLSVDEREKLMGMVSPETAADLLARISETQVVGILDKLNPEKAANIIQELGSDEAADLLGVLKAEGAEAILCEMQPKEASEVRELMAYAEDTAGGLMRFEFLSYPVSSSVGDVIEDLRRNAEIYSDFDVQYAYVVDKSKRLVGVLRMRDLLLSTSETGVSELMIHNPLFVPHSMEQSILASMFKEKQLVGLPVVDENETLLGVVLRSSVREATAEAVAEDFLKVSGLGGKEELRSMPLQLRSRRRLSWLSINILLNVLAASVIAFFQDTLAQVIALAVFLPIISDMSGCSGSQAVAVSIRELTLGLVRPTELLRVFLKEIAVGIVNGIALGMLIALVAFLWKGNPWLGLVVGGALMLNTIVAVCLGGLIPLILKRLDLDPALASGPILTTVTDMCGFFLALSLATILLPYLT